MSGANDEGRAHPVDDPAGTGSAGTGPTTADFRHLADAIPQLAWIADGEGSIFWYNQPMV